MYFAEFNGFIVTANADGSIPLNARVVAKLLDFDPQALTNLLSQANEYERGKSEPAERS